MALTVEHDRGSPTGGRHYCRGEMLAIASTQHWYQSATLWGALGAVAVVVIGVLTIAVTYFIGTARPILNYSLPISIPLLSLPPRPDLEVIYKGQSLQHPHTVMVNLINSGRRDISSGSFDQQKPIVLDIGVPIVDLLGEERHRELVVDGTAVKIPPRLIRRREEISISLLCDGQRPSLTCQSHLIDVKVKKAGALPTYLAWFLLPYAIRKSGSDWLS